MTRSRSWLFVPGNRADRVDKAFASAADAIIIDLEDACPVADKAGARSVASAAASANADGRCFVRINAASTALALADLEAVIGPGLKGIVLPKAETAEMLHTVDWVIGQLEIRHGLAPNSIELVPLIETALGVVDMVSLARVRIERVQRLTFGAGDLSVDLGRRWSAEEDELSAVRSDLVTASRAAGLAPPIDTVWPGIVETQGFIRSVDRAREAGFAGKLLIHPSQIEPANAGFTPSPTAVAHAQRVLDAAAAAEANGQGAFQLDGRLYDHVSVVQARRTLEATGIRT